MKKECSGTELQGLLEHFLGTGVLGASIRGTDLMRKFKVEKNAQILLQKLHRKRAIFIAS